MTRLRLARPAPQNLTGRNFGRWTVRAFIGRDKKSMRVWRCVCDCGTERDVQERSLVLGGSGSCGCLRDELLAKRGLRHGDARERSALYVLWSNIRQRCLNPESRNYRNYGARGIGFHAPWADSYTTFKVYIAEALGPRPNGASLDRIDNDKSYEPGNVRWANRRQQSRNQQRTVRLTHRGKTLLLVEWAEELGISPKVIETRLARGWSVDRALSEPPHWRRAVTTEAEKSR